MQRTTEPNQAPLSRSTGDLGAVEQRAVLIVDGDVYTRRIAAALLAARGFPVRLAEDGRHAWEIIERDGARIAVVVVDLDLCASDRGQGLPGNMRRHFGGLAVRRRPRIVGLSNDAPPGLLEPRTGTSPATTGAALGLRSDVILRKPLVPYQFVTVMDELLAAFLTQRTIAPAELARFGSPSQSPPANRARGVEAISPPKRTARKALGTETCGPLVAHCDS